MGSLLLRPATVWRDVDPLKSRKKVGFRLGQVIALHLAPINKKKNNYTYSVYMMNVDLDIRKI